MKSVGLPVLLFGIPRHMMCVCTYSVHVHCTCVCVIVQAAMNESIFHYQNFDSDLLATMTPVRKIALSLFITFTVLVFLFQYQPLVSRLDEGFNPNAFLPALRMNSYFDFLLLLAFLLMMCFHQRFETRAACCC